MKYGEQDCLRDLMKIRESAASDDDETALTFYLLSVLEDQGAKGIVALIQRLDQSRLGQVDSIENDFEVTINIDHPEFARLVVAAGDDEFAPWIDVRIDPDAGPAVSLDPAHEAFYAIWEKFVNEEIVFVENGSGQEGTVYLIGTLESEIMNGGFGQYLTNTEGRYLSETLDCLLRIGAEKTRAALTAAVELAAGFDSYIAAWDAQAEKYSSLDDEFLESAEDLAGLTMAAFRE